MPMSSSLKRRVERLEQAVGMSESDDPRAYTYPNDFSEGMIMARMTDQQLKEYLRKRTKRPSSEACDRFDEVLKLAAEHKKEILTGGEHT